MNYPLRKLFIGDDVRADSLVRRFQDRFPGLQIIRSAVRSSGESNRRDIHTESGNPTDDAGAIRGSRDPGSGRASTRTGVKLIHHPGSFIKEFPNHPWYGNSGCDYSLILGYNCFCSCTYCFIQTIFDDRTPTLYVNTDDMVAELTAFLDRDPVAWVSTGEYLDSFQLDDVTRTNEILIEVFRRYPGSTLELRTKIDNVAHLPDNPPTNVLVTYSLNPPEVIKHVEPGTATFERRLEMAGILCSKGYRVGLRIDPIIPTEAFASAYRELPALIQNILGWDKVDRVFIGALRFDGALLTRMSTLPHASFLLDAEYIRCPDGNYRPHKHARTAAYRSISNAIREHAPDLHISISMEPDYIRRAIHGGD